MAFCKEQHVFQVPWPLAQVKNFYHKEGEAVESEVKACSCAHSMALGPPCEITGNMKSNCLSLLNASPLGI